MEMYEEYIARRREDAVRQNSEVVHKPAPKRSHSAPATGIDASIPRGDRIEEEEESE